jgi:hypothetical protein
LNKVNKRGFVIFDAFNCMEGKQFGADITSLWEGGNALQKVIVQNRRGYGVGEPLQRVIVQADPSLSRHGGSAGHRIRFSRIFSAA